MLRATGLSSPLIAVLTEGGLAGLTASGASTTSSSTAPDRPRSTPGCGWRSPARTRARTRSQRLPIRAGEVVIDEATYSARVRGQLLDLTYKEFELLKFLAQHPGRVFTRAQLLQEVWGYDYFGGTRTVDVHVRRLRAKLGPEHEALIGTVRNVGYRFVADRPRERRRADVRRGLTAGGALRQHRPRTAGYARC